MMYYNMPKPERFNPIPRPVPDLAETPMDGTKQSNKLKLALAVSAINMISSTFKDRFGMTNATTATTNPSIKYLMTRFTSSATLINPFIYNNCVEKKGV